MIAVKHFVYSDQEGVGREYLGKFTMFGNEVRKHVGNKSEVVETFDSDLGRIQALRMYFGMNVRDEDAAHAKGRAGSLG